MQKEKTETLLSEEQMVRSENYHGVDRRKEDDPAYFGHYALEGLERRRSGSIFEH